MAKSNLLKPGHKAILEYYKALAEYRERGARHEGAVETAFSRLLADTARPHGWVLIPKEKLKVGKHTIFPDGTLHDLLFNELRRGYWEAKDTDDDLDAEISKKLAKGYPRNNTIFEDTRTAVLYQGGVERYRLDLTDPKQLCSLLNEFYAWTDPEIGSFNEAVEEFKSRVPELAQGLVKILADAHQKDRGFQAAFDSFYTVCQQTLNPNISRAAVDEMLVQHFLTERLIRKIFDNPELWVCRQESLIPQHDELSIDEGLLTEQTGVVLFGNVGMAAFVAQQAINHANGFLLLWVDQSLGTKVLTHHFGTPTGLVGQGGFFLL
jgi:hypothetical protein